jgi:hypothetical protein
VQDLNSDRDQPKDNGKKPASSVEDKAHKSSLTLPLRAGKVTGLPKDLTNAPEEIRLSQKISECGDEALRLTQQSDDEYGGFLHFDETGQIRPGEVRGPSEHAEAGEWITRGEYVTIKQQDPTIHGLLHTHPTSALFPGGELTFSPGNLGLLLEVEDTLLICRGPAGGTLLALRTQATPPGQQRLGSHAARAYQNHLPAKLSEGFAAGLEAEAAITQAVFKAMLEVCKTYNIAVYKSMAGSSARKVEVYD